MDQVDLPRLRIDQILTLEWKYLVPIGLANLLLMVIVVVFKLHFLAMSNYIKGVFHGVGTLMTGMKVTLKEFFTPKVTEQYPENRAALKMYDRFCGELTMPHDAEGRNKCIACGLCQSACPNGTIRLTTETVVDPETGKSKKRLARYEYDLGSCMFCRLCVNACPTGAICFSTRFEHAVYTREKLVKQLNKQ